MQSFSESQMLPTVGAYDWTHFHVEEYHFLVVANSFTGPPESSTRLASVIHFWQNGQFLPFQSLMVSHKVAMSATNWLK